jgi:hypothetical protein
MINYRFRKDSLPDDLPSVQRRHLLTKAILLFALMLGSTANIGYSQDLDFLTPLTPAATLALRSQTGDTPTSIVFVNDYNKEIVVYWVNYSGQLVFYRFLAPGDFYIQGTYLTHPWIVYDQVTGLPIEGFLPIAREAIALVGQPAISGPDKQQCGADEARNQEYSLAVSVASGFVKHPLLKAGLDSLGLGLDALAGVDEKCTIDPPDPNYTEVAKPVISIQPPVKPVSGEITSAEATAMNDLNVNLATASGVLNAAITSSNRALGAEEAGNKRWQAKQTKMAKFYINWYKNLATEEQTLAVQLRNALMADGVPIAF